MEISAAFQDLEEPARKLERNCVKKCSDRTRGKGFKVKAW